METLFSEGIVGLLLKDKRWVSIVPNIVYTIWFLTWRPQDSFRQVLRNKRR
nr:MAG TPA: hypothetical protein [Caudoviricetes sp.]